MDALREDDFFFVFWRRQQSEAMPKRCTTYGHFSKISRAFFIVVFYFLLRVSTKYCAWFGCILDTEEEQDHEKIKVLQCFSLDVFSKHRLTRNPRGMLQCGTEPPSHRGGRSAEQRPTE
ncbi:hypothetical protein BDA96_05G023500 [Sorghum bicolor]|uniref:Uncharacterized protein n=1 Tax=Sorghum bicolor TaxID=4558 RepID=A0A921QXN7_SORBI|nr:hypothetical protein BDA96_05G023500 [Sorghum bicolor]